MDLGKDQSHLKHHRTLDPHQEENHSPEVIGTWSLRNRDQLRKRKAEVQEKETSQWLFGEQKKRKQQRTGKGNQRGRKRQQNTELKVEPQSQIEKEIVEKVLAPTEKKPEPPGSITKVFPSVASPQKVVPEEHFSEICEESIIHQENSSKYQEIAVQNHSSETWQHVAEPEDLSPKMYQEISVLQDNSSKICQDVVETEDNSPNACRVIAVIQDHPFKMYQDMAKPDLSPKMCQEAAVPKVLPCPTSEDTADLAGCSLQAYPKPDVPKGYILDTDQNPAEPEEYNETDQGIAETEGFFPKTQEIAEPKDLSTKTHQELVEPKHLPHKTCKEIIVPKAPSHKTIQETPHSEDYSTEINQETPGSEKYSPETYQEIPGLEEYSPEIYQETPQLEEYSPEIYQETPGPEDLSTKTYKNKDVPKECFPEPYQETGGPQGQDPKAHQEDAKDVYTFPQETKEKPKEEPEIPAILNEIHPENDVYSYVLF
ncbi:hemogen [Chlorocebus sabaeus]|uniref:hemogen n=1 Tax=Chlorocebus sabaeus TaxID=60711 RepID=UPI003BF9B73E